MVDMRSRPESHAAFSWQQGRWVQSMGLRIDEYKHDKTQAIHCHIQTDHPESACLVAFRTLPQNSMGAAHILEHVVLCGSQRYPVRDPFFLMMKRSLSSFMNAMTSSDWTAYPFASQNTKDFLNLMDVYLDAAFFPMINRLDFEQEGHHLFFKSPEAMKALQYGGVVFNEMKGALSGTDEVLWSKLMKYLYPSTTYHHISGGDPAHIVDLTHSDLINFHKKYYHPSNALFMTFGQLPTLDLQTKINDQVLASFDAPASAVCSVDEKHYYAPIRLEEAYAIGAKEDTERKTYHTLGWLLGHRKDQQAWLESHLLSSVLLDHSASPLRQVLEQTKLGQAPAAICGLEDGHHEMCFIAGIEGSEQSASGNFETLVLDTLDQVAQTGIEIEKADAVLRQIELSQREIGGSGYPYGLKLMMNALSAFVHNGDMLSSLDLDPQVAVIREKIQSDQYIPHLIRHHLLDNQHRVLLSMRPDTGLAARQRADEQARLHRLEASLTTSDRQAIVEATQVRLAHQEEIPNEEILPQVDLEDVERQLPVEISADRLTLNTGTRILRYTAATNGLLYQLCAYPCPELNAEEMSTAHMLMNVLPELGAGPLDYLAVQSGWYQQTGGVSASLHCCADPASVDRLFSYWTFSGKSLEKQAGQLIQLIKAQIDTVRFDEHDRLGHLVAQQAAYRLSNIAQYAHQLAATAASASHSAFGRLQHQMQGLGALQSLKNMASELQQEDAFPAFAERLSALMTKMRQSPAELMLVHAESDLDVEALFSAWSQTSVAALELASKRIDQHVLQAESQQKRSAWLINAQVNFCARAYPTVSLQHPDSAVLTVLGLYLRDTFLHKAIREQGGAYGSGAAQNADAATFQLYSYRDPRLLDTFQDFDRSIESFMDQSVDQKGLQQAILGVIRAMDKPMSPVGEVQQAYHRAHIGRTLEARQAYRDRLLDTDAVALKRVANQYLQSAHATEVVVSHQAEHALLQDNGFDCHIF